MQSWLNRAGWVLAGIVSIVAIVAVTGIVRAGPLDPPGPPGSTAGVRGPGTPIPALPFTISASGYYYVTDNLTPPSATDGITVNANDVTLDLKGFTLTGVGKAGTGVIANAVDVSVLNGVVTNWGTGVNLPAGTVESVRAFGNVIGIDAYGTVRGCTVQFNSTGIRMGTGTVRDCDIGPNNTGIVAKGNVTIGTNHFQNNSFAAIDVAGVLNVIRDNSSDVSGSLFINVEAGASSTLIIRNRYECAHGIANAGSNTFIPNALTVDTNYCF